MGCSTLAMLSSWVSLAAGLTMRARRAQRRPSTSSIEGRFAGSDTAYPPFEFIEDGEVMGFDVDLVAAIAERLGVDSSSGPTTSTR
jgi:ABC-type amino acid transport substrate-binding protein